MSVVGADVLTTVFIIIENAVVLQRQSRNGIKG